METQSIQATTTVAGDEPDFYSEHWSRSNLPFPVKYRLEHIDRRANVVMVLSEMVAAHVRGKSDAANNEGVKYTWLNDRQASALCDALTDLSTVATEDLEWIRRQSATRFGEVQS